jgi:putative redox protein
LSNVPLLVLHAPDDQVVPAREASRVFASALHPKSFIALDGVDHDISEPCHARRVAGLIAAWAEPYLPDHAPSPPSDPTGSVVVTDAGTGRYTQTITAGRHLLTADEPLSVGGTDAGPNPYELTAACCRRSARRTTRAPRMTSSTHHRHHHPGLRSAPGGWRRVRPEHARVAARSR